VLCCGAGGLEGLVVVVVVVVVVVAVGVILRVRYIVLCGVMRCDAVWCGVRVGLLNLGLNITPIFLQIIIQLVLASGHS